MGIRKTEQAEIKEVTKKRQNLLLKRMVCAFSKDLQKEGKSCSSQYFIRLLQGLNKFIQKQTYRLRD